MSHEVIVYRDLLAEIKVRVRKAQHRAIQSANAEMIWMYWDIGRMIAFRKDKAGWGAGVIRKLSIDLKNELPEVKGFSETNLKRMVQFHEECSALFPIGAQPVPQLNIEDSIGNSAFSQLSWGHHILLIQKVKDLPTRMWYARQTIEQGWSRDILTAQIKSQAHQRQGAAITNFGDKLPAMHAQLATGMLKDPFIFDFLTLEEPFHERELETGLLHHIEKFLLELGRGFAFVGRQYRLDVSDRDYYLDLLFYQLQLRCFVVVDLKKGEFKPEYAGKMNFYCSVVDDQLRHPHDQPTLLGEPQGASRGFLCIEGHSIPAASALPLTLLPEKLASSLPSIEAIEAELSLDLDKEANDE